MAGRVIGIDLGTTNSCVAILENDGTTKIIPNLDGHSTTPSIIYYPASGDPVVGVAARNGIVSSGAETVLYGIKRLIGRKVNTEEVRKLQETSPFKIVENSNGDAWVEVTGRRMAPPEVSAQVLKALRRAAEAYLGETVSEAIITVPAYFNSDQRQATIDAGKIAGLKVDRVINEPTAAALAYGFKNYKEKEKTHIAVFDLGGGTFDISILCITNDGTFEVLSSTGDTFLGGENFDEELLEHVLKEIKNQDNVDLKNDSTALSRIKEEVEKAKKALSSAMTYQMGIPFLTASVHLNMEISRETFEKLISKYLTALEGPCLKAVKDSGLELEQIDEVILVGGSTRVPAIQAKVKDIFKKEPTKKDINPDEVVAAGAAVQAAIIDTSVGANTSIASLVDDIALLDVAPLPLGISVVSKPPDQWNDINTGTGTSTGVNSAGGGSGANWKRTRTDWMSVIIPKNTTVPAQRTSPYVTVDDNQIAMDIDVLQGESPYPENNHLLGNFTLEGLTPRPAGKTKVDVTFDIDLNGIIKVTAVERETGKQAHITIKGNSGLEKHEIDRMANNL